VAPCRDNRGDSFNRSLRAKMRPVEAVSKCRGSPAVAGELVRMSIEFHQPDVAPEVAEHEDDLIGRRDGCCSTEERRHHHLDRGVHVNPFALRQPRSASHMSCTHDDAANRRVRTRRQVIQQAVVGRPEWMACRTIDDHPRRLGDRRAFSERRDQDTRLFTRQCRIEGDPPPIGRHARILHGPLGALLQLTLDTGDRIDEQSF
jgi:hypothetical protein